jgi:hypothetical protein
MEKDKLKTTLNKATQKNSIKNQVASDMAINEQSQELGIFSGQLGGVIVKDLIEEGEKKLMEEDGNK